MSEAACTLSVCVCVRVFVCVCVCASNLNPKPQTGYKGGKGGQEWAWAGDALSLGVRSDI